MNDRNGKRNDNYEKNYDLPSAQMSMKQNRNPYARSYDEDNAEFHRRAAIGQRPANTGSSTPVPRKVRKRPPALKFNWGLLVFSLIAVSVIILSIVVISKNNSKNPANELPPPPVGANDENPVDNDPIPEGGTNTKDEIDSFDVVMTADKLDDGTLILVNYEHEYADANSVETVNIYDERSSPFKVANRGIELSAVAFEAFEAMVNGLNEATGCDDMIVNSGYRTVQDQIDIYDYYVEAKGEDYAKSYVANPKESEHHTALACDLSFYLDEGYSEPVGKHEHGSWLSDNCTDYGFIVRYPASKVEYTHIAHEEWHFRYVGEAHAKAITELGMCLEEYIEYIEEFSLDAKILFITDDGKVKSVGTDSIPSSGGWLVYYVPASPGGSTTVTVLGGEDADYDISGTNAGGFVVTVRL